MINENQYSTLIESYKVTLDDKREIDVLIKGEYDEYLKEYQSTLQDISSYGIMAKMTDIPKQALDSFKLRLDGSIGRLSDLKSKKHDGYMLYNEFYTKNYSRFH